MLGAQDVRPGPTPKLAHRCMHLTTRQQHISPPCLQSYATSLSKRRVAHHHHEHASPQPSVRELPPDIQTPHSAAHAVEEATAAHPCGMGVT
mmetsp:Transcript_42045/g.84415  ORF Transcript_42045/g.84415 Transcript_42045/m.84415 type:complete len:92 (-) Transcript_42045:1560-1835(-)